MRVSGCCVAVSECDALWHPCCATCVVPPALWHLLCCRRRMWCVVTPVLCHLRCATCIVPPVLCHPCCATRVVPPVLCHPCCDTRVVPPALWHLLCCRRRMWCVVTPVGTSTVVSPPLAPSTPQGSVARATSTTRQRRWRYSLLPPLQSMAAQSCTRFQNFVSLLRMLKKWKRRKVSYVKRIITCHQQRSGHILLLSRHNLVL